MSKFKTKKLSDPFEKDYDEWMLENMVKKYGRKWALKNIRQKRFTFVWVYLGIAFFLFIFTAIVSVFLLKGLFNKVKDVEVEPKANVVVLDMNEYNCPPNLSDYQCEIFVRTALVNGFDVDEFLLSRYK